MLDVFLDVAFMRVSVEDVEAPPELRFSRLLGRLFLDAVDIGQAICAVLLTAPRPSARVWPTRSAWTLRGLATASAILTLLALPFPNAVTFAEGANPLSWLSAAIAMLLPLAGLWYVSSLFRELGLMRRARAARNVAVAMLLAPAFFLLFGLLGPTFVVLAWLVIVGCLVRGLVLIATLRKALQVRAHQWWVDATDVTTPVWASFVTSGVGRAEVMLANGERLDFLKSSEAALWLEEQGYIRGKRAVSSGIAKQLPASPFA